MNYNKNINVKLVISTGFIIILLLSLPVLVVMYGLGIWIFLIPLAIFLVFSGTKITSKDKSPSIELQTVATDKINFIKMLAIIYGIGVFSTLLLWILYAFEFGLRSGLGTTIGLIALMLFTVILLLNIIAIITKNYNLVSLTRFIDVLLIPVFIGFAWLLFVGPLISFLV